MAGPTRSPFRTAHRQHRGLGHRLQLRQRRLPARHPRRPGGGRRTLARPVADRLYLPSADAGEAVTDATRHRRLRLVALAIGWLAPSRLPRTPARAAPGSTSSTPARCRGFAPPAASRRWWRTPPTARPAPAPWRCASLPSPPASTWPSPPRPASRRSPPRRRLRPARLPASRSCCASGPPMRQPRRDVLAVVDGTEHLPDTEWTVPGNPVVEAGVRIAGPAAAGTVYLDYLDWRGVPRAHLGRPGRQRRGDDPGRGAARRPCRRAATPHPHRRRRDHYRQRWRPACAVRVRRDLRRRRRGSTLHGRPYRSERRAHRPAAGDTRDLARAPRGSLQGAYLTYFSHCALADSNCSISTRRE